MGLTAATAGDVTVGTESSSCRLLIARIGTRMVKCSSAGVSRKQGCERSTHLETIDSECAAGEMGVQ